jgi:hypothetical protein
MQTKNLLFTALLAFVLPSGLGAQDAPDPQDAPDRWRGEIGLSLNGSGGNERLTVFASELGLNHLQTERYELDFRARARYGRSEGIEVARSVRGAINAEVRPGAPWSPFVFVTAEHDRFRRLDARVNSGFGAKRTFWGEGWNDISLSGAVLYSYEQLMLPDTVDNVTRTARWSWRGRARAQLREGTRVEQLLFFQPAWRQIGDYLVEAQTTGRFGLSQSLALTTSFLYQRDSTPAPDVSPDDWSMTVGLSIATTW